MKITYNKLKQIIKEELANMLADARQMPQTLKSFEQNLQKTLPQLSVFVDPDNYNQVVINTNIEVESGDLKVMQSSLPASLLSVLSGKIEHLGLDLDGKILIYTYLSENEDGTLETYSF